jgi:hypothetical protein
VSARLAMQHGDSPWHGIIQALCYFAVLTNILVTLIATRLTCCCSGTWEWPR